MMIDEARFYEKVRIDPDGCHRWTGARREGYGRLTLGGRTYNAHRVAWEIANGPIPAGMLVCHCCDNPACINPDHLFLGTALDNARDAVAKDRLWRPGRRRLKRIALLYRGGTITANGVRRGRPSKGYEAETLSARKPWTAAGMSRASWYRRKNAGPRRQVRPPMRAKPQG